MGTWILFGYLHAFNEKPESKRGKWDEINQALGSGKICPWLDPWKSWS
jgi:hypothetical protein